MAYSRAVAVGLSALLLVVGCAQAPEPAPTPTTSAPAVTAGTASATVPPAQSTPAPSTPTPTVQADDTTATSAPAAVPVADGPLLMITAPGTDALEVPAGTRSVVVYGLTRPDAVVSVNGVVATVDATGAFNAEVILEDELTVVEVLASDGTGRQEAKHLVIARD